MKNVFNMSLLISVISAVVLAGCSTVPGASAAPAVPAEPAVSADEGGNAETLSDTSQEDKEETPAQTEDNEQVSAEAEEEATDEPGKDTEAVEKAIAAYASFINERAADPEYSFMSFTLIHL